MFIRSSRANGHIFAVREKHWQLKPTANGSDSYPGKSLGKVEPREEEQRSFQEPNCSRRAAAPWCHRHRTMLPLGSPCCMFASQLLHSTGEGTRDVITSHCDCTDPASPTDPAVCRQGIFHSVLAPPLKPPRAVVTLFGCSGDNEHDKAGKKC